MRYAGAFFEMIDADASGGIVQSQRINAAAAFAHTGTHTRARALAPNARRHTRLSKHTLITHACTHAQEGTADGRCAAAGVYPLLSAYLASGTPGLRGRHHIRRVRSGGPRAVAGEHAGRSAVSTHGYTGRTAERSPRRGARR